MKKILAIIMALSMLCLAGCGSKNETTDITKATSLKDLKGTKIAAQAGTFHADALSQIEDVNSSTYPDFTDLLVALKSGAIDGYIAEEPTAFSVIEKEDTLTYIPLKNNDTGFTAGKEDVSIAIGLKKGSELKDSINAVLAEISEETKADLMKQIVDIVTGKTVDSLALQSEAPAETTGVFRIGMECGYEPYNWLEKESERTLGSVPVSGEGKEGMYANGYDVQIAQYVANKLGLKLEIYQYEFDSLIPAVQSGTIDAIVAGMSPTAEREEEIDFTSIYYESNLVVIIKKK